MRYFMENKVQKPGVSRGPWLHNTAIFKDNPGKKLTRYGKSETHLKKSMDQQIEKRIRVMNCMLKS